MPGLAKSAPIQVSVKVAEAKTTQNAFQESQSVHQEFYNFFNSTSGETDKLKFVSDWAMEEGKTLGTALKKLRGLEIKLGAPSLGETRLGKLYNWLRLSGQAAKAKASQVDSLATIKSRHQAKLLELRQNRNERVAKIQVEIDRVNQEYKKARSIYLREATIESKKVENEYGSILTELNSMRDAYRGKT